MNGATIGAIAAALIAMISAGLALWVNRTDRASKLTRENMDNLLRDSRTLSAMRTDVWNWEAWGHAVSVLWRDRERHLLAANLIDHITELPDFPDSHLRQLENELAHRDQT